MQREFRFVLDQRENGIPSHLWRQSNIYGARATGNYTDHSDIIQGTPHRRIRTQLRAQVGALVGRQEPEAGVSQHKRPGQ
jgi:hypothetical protein